MILFIGWARLATATLTFFNKTLPNFVKWIGKRIRLKRVEKANIKHIEETKKIDELFKDYVKHKVSKNKSSVTINYIFQGFPGIPRHIIPGKPWNI